MPPATAPVRWSGLRHQTNLVLGDLEFGSEATSDGSGTGELNFAVTPVRPPFQVIRITGGGRTLPNSNKKYLGYSAEQPFLGCHVGVKSHFSLLEGWKWTTN